LLTELDVLLEDFNNELKEIKDKYEFMINKKSSELNLPDEKYRNLINKMGDNFYQISTELIKNANIEQKLLESEEKYYQITENLYDVILVLNENFKVEYVNELPLFRIAGYHRNDLIGQECIKFIHEDDLEKALNEFSKFFETGEATIEVRLKDKNGRYIWTEAKGMIFKDKDGKPKALITVRDISRRKRAEKNFKKSEERLRLLNNELRQRVEKRNEKIKESEERYRLITENANDLMVIVNENLEFEWMNEQVHKKLRGFSNKDRIGKTALNFIHPDDLDIAIKTFKKGFEVGEGMGVVRMKNKNGNYDWLEVRGKKFTDKDGKEKALLISRNITERQQAENALKKSQTNLETLVNSINDFLFVIGFDGSILRVNNTVLNRLGYTQEEILNMTLLDLHPPDRHDEVKTIVAQMLEDKTDSCNIPIMAKNGDLIPVETKISKGLWGEKEALFGISRDITKRIKSEQKLKESEERYRSLFENMNAGFAYHKVITDDNNKPIDYRYIEVNPAFEKFTGLKANDMIGKNVTEILPGTEKDPADWIGRFGNVGLTGVPLIVEDYSDALDRWYKVSGYSPKKGFFAVTFTDITERKKAEQKIKEQNKFLTNVIESLTHPFYVINVNDFTIEMANSAANLGDPIGDQKCFFLTHHNDKQCTGEYPCPINIVKETKSPAHVEHIHYDEKGNLRNVDVHGYPIFDEIGEVTQMIEYTIDVTEHKKAEQKLIESEEKFRKITEQSLMGICIAQDNKIKYINKTYADIWGYSIEEIMNWQLKDAANSIHPDDRDFTLEQLAKKQRGEQDIVAHYSFRGFKKSGEIIWVDQYSKTIKYENRTADLVTLIDITEKKEAEQKLKESEERFRTLFEVAPASIMVADLESNIVMCNEKFCKLHGFENPEIVKGRKFSEFISKKDRLKLSEGVKETLEGNNRDIISYTMLKNDGTEFPAEATSSAIKDKDGNIIGIIGVAQDITKRKKAEQIVKESEEKFRTIAEQSFMGIIILQDEKLKYVNEAGAKIFDYSVEEVMNWSKNYMVEKCIHPEDLPILREKRELRRRGEFNLKPYISYRVITKSGNIKWIDQFSRIIVYQGKEAELISIIDITDQKEAEKIITEENKKLLELDQMRKELLTRVSHELKTPLVSIFSCSELLIDYYQEQMSEEVMKFIEIIHRGGKRLKDLIKNLLDASQIDAGKLKINKEKANLIEIIRNCIDYVKFLIDDRKISLDYELPEELFVEVDRIRIEQVFTNILSNAIKNTPSNGNIGLNVNEEDNHIYITIKDTGVGLTKKEMDKIFKKFGKIERYGKELDVDIEGSGLGLYISKEIVNLHEGMIWVESEGRNKGATFTIKLPTRK